MPGTVPVTGLTALKRTDPKFRGMKKAVEEVGDRSEFSAGRPMSLWIQRKRVKAGAKE